MKHNNVVWFIDEFVSDEMIVLILEFCEFGDLKNLINQRKNQIDEESVFKLFSEKEIMNIFIQICEGVRYLHW